MTTEALVVVVLAGFVADGEDLEKKYIEVPAAINTRATKVTTSRSLFEPFFRL